ncbi:MAG: hypothetical protein QOJ06_2888 [Pseudonocardiales bacterium]|jgi:hypothetical protein|nr:hypothetical protein [Pseudonocardiales bacterium]
MLYTLSYEGPTLCVRRGYRASLVCWVRVGCLVPDGLCRVPWGWLRITASTRGVDCTVGGVGSFPLGWGGAGEL